MYGVDSVGGVDFALLDARCDGGLGSIDSIHRQCRPTSAKDVAWVVVGSLVCGDFGRGAEIVAFLIAG